MKPCPFASLYTDGCILIWKTEREFKQGTNPWLPPDLQFSGVPLRTPAAAATARIHTSLWRDEKTGDSSVGSKGFFHHTFPENKQTVCIWAPPAAAQHLLSMIGCLRAFSSLSCHGAAPSQPSPGTTLCTKN